jgi:hypothetical protein
VAAVAVLDAIEIHISRQQNVLRGAVLFTYNPFYNTSMLSPVARMQRGELKKVPERAARGLPFVI